jgi:transcriptional regulator with XRE-family HTH domain
VTYGEKLRTARAGQGWTQAELAAFAGVSLPALRNYERGERMPGFVAAVRLADALGVPLDEFAATVRPTPPAGGKRSRPG